MPNLSQKNLCALEATARTAASYLDACDGGARYVRLDPAYYQACGNLLMTIFTAIDANRYFPDLMDESAAAREAVRSLEMTQHLNISRLAYYPQLAAILGRAAH